MGSWENVRSKMADEWRENKYVDPCSTEFRTICSAFSLVSLKVTVESPDLSAVVRALSTVVHRSFKSEWGLWAGFQFSAPSAQSEDSLHFRFAEF